MTITSSSPKANRWPRPAMAFSVSSLIIVARDGAPSFNTPFRPSTVYDGGTCNDPRRSPLSRAGRQPDRMISVSALGASSGVTDDRAVHVVRGDNGSMALLLTARSTPVRIATTAGSGT